MEVFFIKKLKFQYLRHQSMKFSESCCKRKES